jgi:mannose-6-phosphate isomerase-like protein (cupin superfamily)
MVEALVPVPVSSPVTVLPGGGDQFDFGGLGVRWTIPGQLVDQRFAIVHHPLAPHALAAPLHRHHNEDELSFVLKGRLGAMLGDDVVRVETGTWVFKPRGQWHSFWNDGDVPCEIIEILSPAGFENYFREVANAWGDVTKFVEINARYALEMNFDSVPTLCARFGLTFPPL